jgi:hypothetical protein
MPDMQRNTCLKKSLVGGGGISFMLDMTGGVVLYIFIWLRGRGQSAIIAEVAWRRNRAPAGSASPRNRAATQNGKPKDIPGNYRGITISPLLGKVLDKILAQHQQQAAPQANHPLQFDFTKGRNGTHGAFLITEAMAEAQERCDPLFILSLDVQKSFWHSQTWVATAQAIPPRTTGAALEHKSWLLL